MTTGDESLLSSSGTDDPDRNGRWMVQTVARLLGGEHEAISETVHLEDLGLSGFRVATLVEKLEQQSGTSINLEDRCDIPTIESFAALFVQLVLKGGAGGNAHH